MRDAHCHFKQRCHLLTLFGPKHSKDFEEETQVEIIDNSAWLFTRKGSVSSMQNGHNQAQVNSFYPPNYSLYGDFRVQIILTSQYACPSPTAPLSRPGYPPHHLQSKHRIWSMYDACVPWPERPKGAKDKSRGPKLLVIHKNDLEKVQKRKKSFQSVGF